MGKIQNEIGMNEDDWGDGLFVAIMTTLLVLLVAVICVLFFGSCVRKDTIVDAQKDIVSTITEERKDNVEVDKVAIGSESQNTISIIDEVARVVIEETVYDSVGRVAKTVKKDIDYARNGKTEDTTEKKDSIGIHNNINVSHTRDAHVEDTEKKNMETSTRTVGFDYIPLVAVFVGLSLVYYILKR